MWLVKRSDPKPGPDATCIPKSEIGALRAAYRGEGTAQEVIEATALVKRARMFKRWFACDCRAEEKCYPLISPAYLTDHQRYYLRRLTGEGREEHHDTCDFRFERQEAGLDPIEPDKKKASYAKKPKGMFSVLGNERATAVSAEQDNRQDKRVNVRTRAIPALARHLWRLMEDAGLNRLEPIQTSERPSIQSEFEALKKAADNIYVADDLPLSKVLGTYGPAYHSNRMFARIRKAYNDLSYRSDKLEGFMLLYTPSINGQMLNIGKDHEPIQIAGELKRPSHTDNDRRAPYLSLAVIGEHKAAGGLLALRAYAQPIRSASQFVPVESDFERQTLIAINRVRFQMMRSDPDILIAIIKPLFSMKSGQQECLPDFVLEMTNAQSGEVKTLIIEAMGYDNEIYYASKARTHPIMEAIAPVFTIKPDELLQKNDLDKAVSDAIKAVL